MVPEQPLFGPLYSAEALDPSAFIGLDSAAGFLQDKAGKERVLCSAGPSCCLGLKGTRVGNLSLLKNLGGKLMHKMSQDEEVSCWQ